MRPLSPRAALVLVLVSASCSAPPAGGALQVLVNLDPGLISRCVKVVATDGDTSRETDAIALDGKASPLRVAVYGEGFTSPVTVQAVGFADTACMVRSGELSELVEANFSSSVGSVTVTLSPVNTTRTDGGTDAGTDAGIDAGVDAGIDQDQDGVPLPADCDDTNPNIRPGLAEVCTNGVDDNCNGPIDCAESTCLGLGCVGGGVCVGTSCTAPTEVSCTDRVDNDNDGFIDCLDSDCAPGTTCNDGDFCTTGESCVSDGGCEKAADFLCTMPPDTAACHAPAGVCRSDGGAVCEYQVLPDAGCDDGFACTLVDTCSALGACVPGPAKDCPAPANTCLRALGCQEPSGLCATEPVDAGTGACSDGDNCTLGDTCDGDGGCRGAMQACPPPSQCHRFSNACEVDGGCRFDARTGLACDAGAGLGAATCGGDFSCTVTLPLFPYVPSNFTEAQLPALDGGNDLVVGCSAEINTSNTPSTDAGCFTLPPFTIITPPGGTSTVLFATNGLDVRTGQTLTISGSRPAIFAVVGDARIDGVIRVRAGANVAPACGAGVPGGREGGGGGGGFGTDGGTGGQSTNPGGRGGGFNGEPTLAPIRGGCPGGSGTTGALGGSGGGGLQLSASGTLTVAGVVTAPGLGGEGATSTEFNGGGGGSGGGLLLEGATLTLTNAARVTANGGGGGGGEDGSGGTAGLPGRETSVTPADGGVAGGGNGGRGGSGAAGSTGANNGFNSGATDDGAGGGGGGVGRIRLNAKTSCGVNGAAVISPPATSNGQSGCP